MDCITFLINNAHFIHNYIYDAFKNYLNQHGIHEAELYYYFDENEKREKTASIILDFIDYNYKIYNNKPLQLHVKEEARIIKNYLLDAYKYDDLPF